MVLCVMECLAPGPAASLSLSMAASRALTVPPLTLLDDKGLGFVLTALLPILLGDRRLSVG